MESEKQENIKSIQLLRGIAAFLVFLKHADPSKYFDNIVLSYISSNGWMGVEIFFIISGFIIPYGMFVKNYQLSDFSNFFIKRITRIEPPYIISIALVLFLSYSTTLAPGHNGLTIHIDWLNVLGHLGYFNAFTNMPWLNVAYWTLAIEFEFYIIIALLFPLITHSNKKILFSTYFLLLIATFLTSQKQHIIIYLPFFLLGISLLLFKCKKITLIEFCLMTIPNFFVCNYLHGYLLLTLSIIVLLSIYFIKNVSSPFLFLGTISYSLYLTHGLIITRYIGLTNRYFKNLSPELKWISCMLFCLFIAYVYYLIVEKPFINLSKKVRFNNPKLIATKEETKVTAG